MLKDLLSYSVVTAKSPTVEAKQRHTPELPR